LILHIDLCSTTVPTQQAELTLTNTSCQTGLTFVSSGLVCVMRRWNRGLRRPRVYNGEWANERHQWALRLTPRLPRLRSPALVTRNGLSAGWIYPRITNSVTTLTDGSIGGAAQRATQIVMQRRVPRWLNLTREGSATRRFRISVYTRKGPGVAVEDMSPRTARCRFDPGVVTNGVFVPLLAHAAAG